MTRPVLLATLKDLLDDEFGEFKWYLLNGKLTDNLISKGDLKRADRHGVVDLMVQQYKESDAGEIAVKALRKMNQNELADKLKGKLKEVSEDVPAGGQKDVPAGGEASSAGKAGTAETPGVTMNINASTGGTVKAPVIHGGVFNGPVNFS